MYDVYVKRGVRHFEPEVISAGSTVKFIFPVPEPNAVGTLDGNTNSITYINFADGADNPQLRIIAKDFSKTVYGNFDYTFSPNFSDEMIAYTKTRVAVICNVKTGEAFHAGFNVSMDDYLLGIRFLDPENSLFAVVKSVDYADWWVDTLHVARLAGKELVDLGKVMKIGETHHVSSDYPAWNRWVIHDRKLFAYEFYNSKDIMCFDGINKTTHPFAEVFNRNKKNFRGLKDMAIHPELPFGVIVEDGNYLDDEQRSELSDEAKKNYRDGTGVHALFLSRWDTSDPGKQFTAIHHKFMPFLESKRGDRMTFAYPSFSPDGEWFVINNGICHIAVPVDKEHPNFLDIDKSVILGQVSRMKSMAWTTGLTALVVSDGEELYKWDLGEVRNARVIAVPD